MYTKGIRKVFTLQPAGGLKFEFAISQAEAAGFKALSFNGLIFIKTEDEWVDTCFHITDFTDDKE